MNITSVHYNTNLADYVQILVHGDECGHVNEQTIYTLLSDNNMITKYSMKSIVNRYGASKYTVNHYRAHQCTALHCTSLHCTSLHCTALHFTAQYCTVLLCVLYLLPARIDSSGNTALHYAKHYPSQDIVKFLLRYWRHLTAT